MYLEPPRGEAETAVNEWVQNHPEWTDDPVAHVFREQATPNGTSHVYGNYFFEQSVGVTTLLDRLEDRLANVQGGLWYRIGYHVCDHDDQDRETSDCAWDPARTREDGGVPADIPTFGGDT